MEFVICMVDGYFPFERFVNLDFGPRETEAFGLGWNLESTSFPLHDVIVADAAFMNEAADAIQILGSGTPGGFGFARSAGEAAVVVGQEAAQHGVGADQIGGAGQAKFAGEAVLKSAPEAFDASLGLRRVGGDVGDAELLEGATELSGLALAGELFFDRPVVVVANEDAVVIAVETEGQAKAVGDAAEQEQIAASIFGGKELGVRHFAGGVVDKTEQGELGAAIFEPVMGAAVEQQHIAFAGARETALAVSGRAPFLW